MKQPTAWKQLERHPLSAEYEDMTGQAWADLVKDISENGFDKRKPIILHDGQILDGWQRQRACIECDVRPTYAPPARGMAVEDVVRRENDQRRHESEQAREKRVRARRERVAKARSEGESIRAIAEHEGVSKATVEEDIKKTGATVQGGTVEGKDGKKRDATKPKPLCDRCQRTGARMGCEKCAELQQAARKAKSSKDDKPEEVKDATGATVPEKALQAFADAKEIVSLCKDLDAIIKRVEEIGKSAGGKMLHTSSQTQTLQNVRKSLWQGRATHLCPYCKGKGTCKPCDSRGWTTKTFYDQSPETIKSK